MGSGLHEFIAICSWFCQSLFSVELYYYVFQYFGILITGAFFFFLDLKFEVKLPELLFHASVEEETLMELQAHLIDFLRFQCFPPGFMLKIVIGDEFNWEK